MITVSILYLITGFLGFIVFVAMLRQYKTNRIANIYLIFILLFVIIRFFLEGVLNLTNQDNLNRPLIGNNPFFALIFPSFYLYFKNLFSNSKNLHNKDLYHFIFPLILGTLNFSVDSYHFQNLHLRQVFHFSFISLVFYYLFLSYKILKKYVWSRKSNLDPVSKLSRRINRWVTYVFIIGSLIAIRILFSLFLSLIKDDYSIEKNIRWIATILWDILFIEVIFSPEILYGYETLNAKIKEKKIEEQILSDYWILKNIIPITNGLDLKLSESISKYIKEYIVKIEAVAQKRDCFRDPNCKLSDFANLIEVPKSHLSYVFKYHCKITFTEFKKTIRIQDAVQLMESGYLNTNTLDSLAQKVGFASYNPFYTSFKNEKGISPQDFIKNQV